MLRIEIEGRWTAKEFSEFFAAVDSIYTTFALVSIEKESAREFEKYSREFFDFPMPSRGRYRRLNYLMRMQGIQNFYPVQQFLLGGHSPEMLLESDEVLKVRRCSYASPGKVDLLGLGESLSHVKDIVLKCIDIFVSKDQRRLNNRLLEEQVEAAALKNVNEKLTILRDLGYTDAQCRQVLAQVSPAVARLESLVQ